MFRVARHTAHRTVVDVEDYYHAMLSVADQWTQMKTGRDSPDFRRWANPFTFMTRLLRKPRHHPARLRHEGGVRPADRGPHQVPRHERRLARNRSAERLRARAFRRRRRRTLLEGAADPAAAAAEGRPRRRGRHAARSRRVNRTAVRDVRAGPRRSRPLRPTISRIRLAIFTHDAFGHRVQPVAPCARTLPTYCRVQPTCRATRPWLKSGHVARTSSTA